ncbi:S-protein homolog 2-like [Silene latifolia]|uniref:S-protein homolog 2-like n=1 Tax=Silene latifolia TaxID=37657 RepID=UPI003D785E0C
MSNMSLIILLMMALFAKFSEGLFGKVDVQVASGLLDGMLLEIHCKSKNDDLGIHVLKPVQTYEFSVTNGVFSSTLYFCGFTFNGKLHWFDIYDQKRDTHGDTDCKGACLWQIRVSGPCSFFDGKDDPVCYPWNKN